MNKALITTLIAATALTGGCTSYGGGSAYDDGGFGYYDRASYQRYGGYDYNRPDPNIMAIMPTDIIAKTGAIANGA